MNGIIFDVKEMALHDGPGIRTTVFLKGCPLRCKWCHNPEGLHQKSELMFKYSLCKGCNRCQKVCEHPECKPFARCVRACPEGLLQIVGESIEATQLAARIEGGAKVLGESFGGVTFSGGEPLMQWEFLLEAAEILSNYHLAIETSGYAESAVFHEILEKMDLVMIDIKLADPEAHKRYTGVDNSLILSNLRELQASGKPHIIRTPLIPGITDTEENLRQIERLVGDSKWERLPYNKMAGAKYGMLGLKYELD
jgi:pyruvate formate lyase activating enzyme